jgi:hypothetical protein
MTLLKSDSPIQKRQIVNLQIINEDIAEGADIATDKLEDASLFEWNTNKVTSISSESTDIEYPSAKLLFSQLAGKANAIGWGARTSSNDAGTLTDMSLDDDYLYVCVFTGIAGEARWKKALLFESL